jgi:predicted Fe-S protein YdhL (DUF1289 family)
LHGPVGIPSSGAPTREKVIKSSLALQPEPGSPEKPVAGSNAVSKSPCIKVCTLNEARYCTGCRRTLAEIVAWASLTHDERLEVLAALPSREV